jgi:plastocyanin
MTINGRTFMGNTPTMVAGRETRMRFGNDGFVPKLMNINVGDTVTWKNNDGTTHSASGPGPNFDTGNISSGATSAPVTFDTVAR